MEKELKALSESSATKEDISRVRSEMKKQEAGSNHCQPNDLQSGNLWNLHKDNDTSRLFVDDVPSHPAYKQGACCSEDSQKECSQALTG